jgi:hypothetical protein
MTIDKLTVDLLPQRDGEQRMYILPDVRTAQNGKVLAHQYAKRNDYKIKTKIENNVLIISRLAKVQI